MPDEKPRCCKKVRKPGRWPDYRECGRGASVERDGQWYCRQHDPEAVAARRAKADAAYQARSDAEDERFRRRAAEAAACRGVATEHLREGLLTELLGGLDW